MACFVEVSVAVARQAAVRLGRDHGSLAGRGQRGEDPFIGVERPVGRAGSP